LIRLVNHEPSDTRSAGISTIKQLAVLVQENDTLDEHSIVSEPRLTTVVALLD